MYLVDTNIFLEALLQQEKAETVRSFFNSVKLEDLFITDFSLQSIGIILFKLKKYKLFVSFIEDMVEKGVNILSLTSDELKELETVASTFKLDFDDSYQYLSARKHHLQLISFDKDFNKAGIDRKEPQEIIF